MQNDNIKEIVQNVHMGGANKFAIISTRWNDEIISELQKSATQMLLQQGVAEKNITQLLVSGAYELPLACQKAAQTNNYDAIIAIGCVIRGDTPHFDYVAGEAARGITDVSLKTNVPVIFGVLTVNNYDQAWQRADRKQDDKGAEFALAALEMANFKPL